MRCSPTCSDWAGTPSVPRDLMASVITLQELHEFSDSETVDAVTFDWVEGGLQAAGDGRGVSRDDVDVWAAADGHLGFPELGL